MQFVVIVVAGGYVSKYYSSIQKEKEAKQSIIHEFSEIFGEFIALRFKVNVHLYKHEDNEPHYCMVTDEELKKIIFDSYNESCNLLGRYQAIKPLIHINFSIKDEEIDLLHNKYHRWRRSLREGKPIYQSEQKVNDGEYKVLRSTYFNILKQMKEQS
jgi:hypothetical protein